MAALLLTLCTLLLSLRPAAASAAEALVAVASNFTEALEQLEAGFEEASGHRLTVTAASTGMLYAQIRSGAPFDVFLAADQERPRLLQEEGDAVPGSRFTYAIGRLTLWSTHPGFIGADGAETLRAARFRTLAIANPDLAPYGMAARETLEALGLQETLNDRIVMGENIGQTHAMVATGNAELGFVALSSVVSPRNESEGSRWDVPQELYTPIRQDAVLLTRAADNPAARDFLAYLEGADARAVIRDFGYGVE
ncbi:MAG: molybdate ABC transporter substrate-binding protein [Woeseiaceae bacterium]